MNDLSEWGRIPSSVRSVIVQGHTGPVRKVVAIGNSRRGVYLRLYGTEQDVFLKATPLRNPNTLLYKRERWASLHLPLDAPAPRLQWATAADGWLVLAWELINDHAEHAYLAPNSLDVPLVLDAMERLGKMLTPSPEEARPVVERVTDLRTMARRALDDQVTPLPDRNLFDAALHKFTPDALQGDTLVHGNLTPRHLRIKDDLVYAVDWSQAARGPAWFDLALLPPLLIEAGHSAKQAAAVLADTPAWAEAPAAQAAALTALWTLARLHQAGQGPEMQRPLEARFADAGRKWLAHLRPALDRN
ncbi:hypothetical protein ACWDRB_47775 [Nonomuraea sp. NPDC003707]